jgi:hypothetical protein
MYIRGCALALTVLLVTGCAGMASDSSLGLAEKPAEEGSIAQLLSGTNSRPRLSEACYTLPRGTMSMGPTAKYCINTPNGFMCMPECRRER